MSYSSETYELSLTKEQLINFLFGTNPEPFLSNDGEMVSISNMENLNFQPGEEIEAVEAFSPAEVTFNVSVSYEGMNPLEHGKGKATLQTKDLTTFTGKIDCIYEIIYD